MKQKVYTKFLKSILYGTVLVGAIISFLFWLPSTMQVIHMYGILAAIYTTHIPRLVLDLLIVAACAIGLHENIK